MITTEAAALLQKFRAGKITAERVLRAFQAAPVADLGFAQVDTHRALRKGFPEVIFGSGKTPEQVAAIATKLLEREQCLLVTRIDGPRCPHRPKGSTHQSDYTLKSIKSELTPNRWEHTPWIMPICSEARKVK